MCCMLRNGSSLRVVYASLAPITNDRYRNPIYISSGSNGFTRIGVLDVLAQTDHTHSPLHTEPRVSYDIPKFKLTQERALPLVRWYEEHQDHPYPSRQEKLNLCQATQLTYTQVSTCRTMHLPCSLYETVNSQPLHGCSSDDVCCVGVHV